MSSCGFAAAHGGKALPYRASHLFNNEEAMPPILRRSLRRFRRGQPESRRLSAMGVWQSHC